MRIDSHVHIGIDPQYYINSWEPYCQDLYSLIKETENMGIDKFVVFPFASYFGMNLMGDFELKIEAKDEAYQIPYFFENNRLLAEIAAQPSNFANRTLPFVIADPLRNAIGQVKSWEKILEREKIYGIKIQPTTTRSPIKSLLKEGSSIIDFARDNNLPFLIHTSIHPNDQWAQTFDILDVVELNPSIRFSLAHSCCFHKASMDRMAQLPNAWMDTSAHVIRCQCSIIDYLGVAKQSDRLDTDYSSPETVLRDIAETYPEKALWGSDAPFYSCRHDKLNLRATYREEVTVLDSLPIALQQKISFQNIVAWIGLEEDFFNE